MGEIGSSSSQPGTPRRTAKRFSLPSVVSHAQLKLIRRRRSLADIKELFFSKQNKSTGDLPRARDWERMCRLPLCQQYHYNLRQFQRIRLLGQGAFGHVFLCRHIPTSTVCVVKVLSKSEVGCKHMANIRRERDALLTLTLSDCPFSVQALGAFQDDQHLFFVTEYISGGEILRYLRKSKRLSESVARFYTAELLFAIEHMHSVHDIAYRDIKPDNILLDSEGHIKLVDMGFAKVIEHGHRSYSLCGNPFYLAPELVTGQGHDRAVDYWALGVFIYEMLVGVSPFFNNERCMVYHRILHADVSFPPNISSTAKSLITALLTVDSTQRLGAGKGGVADIKAHPWFKKIDWDAIKQKRIKPPIKPRITHALDTSNFDSAIDQSDVHSPSLVWGDAAFSDTILSSFAEMGIGGGRFTYGSSVNFGNSVDDDSFSNFTHFTENLQSEVSDGASSSGLVMQSTSQSENPENRIENPGNSENTDDAEQLGQQSLGTMQNPEMLPRENENGLSRVVEEGGSGGVDGNSEPGRGLKDSWAGFDFTLPSPAICRLHRDYSSRPPSSLSNTLLAQSGLVSPSPRSRPQSK